MLIKVFLKKLCFDDGILNLFLSHFFFCKTKTIFKLYLDEGLRRVFMHKTFEWRYRLPETPPILCIKYQIQFISSQGHKICQNNGGLFLGEQ